MRRAYLIVAVAVAFVLFAVFVPIVTNTGSPPAHLSISFALWGFGLAIDGLGGWHFYVGYRTPIF